MTVLDPAFSARAIERIWKAMFAIGAGGALAAFGWRGWEWGAGFLVGAAASALNFRWIKQIVDALSRETPTQARVAVLAGLRYLLLGGGAYVIVKYSSISIAALLMGLFVSAAAVIVEIVIELAYART
jgi:ATP synthase I subunit